ncbi:MAG: glycoside hydrolase family 13 protein [Clostridia bacterium]|nr:glycoside hydrolase family 13 protein [Clostridia bacterium]
MYYPYNSRDTLYKSKFGAVASGESLKLRLLLHLDAKVDKAFLVIRKDGEEVTWHQLTPADLIDDYRAYETDISLENGLYFYKFFYNSFYGDFSVTKNEDGLGTVSDQGDWWQLTCYDKDYTTPDWLKGGVIYQIFPDRFNNSGKAKVGVPNDRFICENPEKEPEYRQGNGPCSLGNDYYGGDIKGITQKLDYLASLGVTCIYLNPIFEAHSNHRYNTADYMKIDPLLGTDKDLEELCRKAQKQGISIILDGVFSHTGDDSIYFNKYGRYGSGGAYKDQNSPYFSWFKFKNWPNDYHSWWGVSTLPETIEEDPSFEEFVTGENGVIRHWMRKGVRGWRLDVADELPDSILDKIRLAIKAEKQDGFLLGEVWEDATNKISYGYRRKYLRGDQLDSVMNYPFADAIIKYVTGGDSKDLIETVCTILENYPKEAVDVLMNHLGTHDTPRLLTRLGTKHYPNSRAEQSGFKLNEEEYCLAKRKQKLAAAIQYTLPGVPSLYYGDEAGMQGFGDPFCRGYYPWGKEDTELKDFYAWLGKLRAENKVFCGGEFLPILAGLGSMAYSRKDNDGELLIAVNRWCESDTIIVPERFANGKVLYGNKLDGTNLTLDAYDFAIIKI